jgi:hypothetical protein
VYVQKISLWDVRVFDAISKLLNLFEKSIKNDHYYLCGKNLGTKKGNYRELKAISKTRNVVFFLNMSSEMPCLFLLEIIFKRSTKLVWAEVFHYWDPKLKVALERMRQTIV